MAQRQTVSGRRSTLAWLAIVLVLVLAIALAAFVLVIGPQQQLRQQAQATAEAHQAEVERLYAAGVAFQDAGDCRRAVESLAQVISTEPGYKDAQSRLAEVHACLQAAEATTTAQAIAVAQATAEANATATAQAIAMTQAAAQANATATAAAGTLAQAAAATATAETAAAIEAAYQRGLGYYNMERWAEAKMTFEEIFAVNPTYKDVQAKLAEVEVRLAEIRALTPTAAPVTPTPVILIFTASTTSGSRDSGWQVPGCGGSFDTDADFHRIPGLSLDVTTDKPGMLLVDFTGLGYNSAVRGAVYTTIFVDGRRSTSAGGNTLLGGCRSSGGGAWCTLANTTAKTLSPGSHTVDIRVWCDGSETARVHSGWVRALLFPQAP